MSLVLTIPEPGQLVDVRQRRYVVMDVAQGTISRVVVICSPASLNRFAHADRYCSYAIPHFFAEGFVSSLTQPPVSLNVTTSLKSCSASSIS